MCSFVTQEKLPGGFRVSCCCAVTGTLPRARGVPVAVGHGGLSVQSGSGLLAGGSSCPRHSQQPAQPDGCPSVLAGLQAADACSAAKMIQHVLAAVGTLYTVAYSGYFLTHLARKSRFSLGAASVPLALLCAFCSPSGAEQTLESNCHEDTIALGELLPAAAAEKGGVCSQRGVHSICKEPWGVLFPQAGTLCQQSLELPPFAAPAKN